MRRFGLPWRSLPLVLTLLVTTLGSALADEVRQRNLVRVRDVPWLRINAGGHTATVQALAFSADSKRLCSAGLDKQVQVWNLTVVRRDLRRVFLRERTIRWQVARGLRGSIYALAASANENLLALGGYGAMGSLGEILLVDPLDGSLVKVLQRHRQTVCSLDFSPGGNLLASMDVAGATFLWRKDAWEPMALYQPDVQTYGAEKAKLIARQPKLRPVAFAGDKHVVVPVFAGGGADAAAQWKLARVNVDDRTDVQTLGTVHHGVVTALAAARDGTRLASADLQGNLFVWDLRGEPKMTARLEPGAIVLSLCFSGDGRRLVAGTAVGGDGKSGLQLWDLDKRSLLAKRSLADHVLACAISPDGRRLAYCGGRNHEVFCISAQGDAMLADAFEADRPAAALRGSGERIWKVAFAAKEPFYRVAFGTNARYRGLNDCADLEQTFDAQRLRLETDAQIKPDDWLAADFGRGDWSAKQRRDGTLQLYRGDEPQGVVALASQVPGLEEGRIRCFCWLGDKEGKPQAIVVGTDRQNSLYVCRLAPRGVCPVLRHFRGHHDFVTSAGISRDRKYVVSGSADGTLRFWSLAQYEQGESLPGKWGADLAVRGDALVVTDTLPAGPLFRKGVRSGDELTRIRWFAEQQVQEETRPAAMLEKLRSLPWGTQVAFDYSRGGSARKPFQLLPAWQPLATLFANGQREWAFWTPEGYYDASINGHRLFGWQINRGLHTLPVFHRADQFRKRLERTDLMQKLLPAGSLHEAFRLAAMAPPKQPEEELAQQIAATPEVTILEPKPDEEVRLELGATKVIAQIKVPDTCRLTSAKVFANGVVSTRQELVEQRQIDGGKLLKFVWDVSLPSDARNMIQVVAVTDAQTSGFQNVVVQRPEPVGPKPTPKLFLLAAGINRYGDPEIQPLEYSVADAQAVVELVRAKAAGLYEQQPPTVLTNEQVTPEKWHQALHEVSQRLKQIAGPDDLLVLFLAGHGMRATDGEAEKYYFIGHDAKLRDVTEAEIYTSCISWDDFRLLADVPCRKLAFLDTCHSGAVQPLRSGNLKAAVRTLHEDVIFTVTASEGGEMAAEDPESKHGVFTRCLLEALSGKADASADGSGDGPGDGIVSLDEVISYVKRRVPEVTKELTGGGGTQHPTAAPDELLPFVSLPLTRPQQ